MISNDNQEQRLFNHLRNTPTELNLEQVEGIIKNLPNLPTPEKVNNDWTNFLNLKNMILMSIPISIAIMLAVFSNTEKLPQPISKMEELPKEIIQQPTHPETEMVAEINEISTSPDVISPQRKPVEPLAEISSRTDLPVLEDKKITVDIEPTTSLAQRPENQIENPTEDLVRKNRAGTATTSPFPEKEINPLPKFTTIRLRKLKRTLYKNLLQDKLIATKYEAVVIDLPGNEIYVNGKKLNANLLLKYSSLTGEVGTGPNRKIKFNQQYIKVGDFTEEGFKGEGFGTFTEEFVPSEHGFFGDTENEVFDKMIKEEQRELDEFADFLTQGKKTSKSKSLFSFNISYKNATQLKKELYELLRADQLIDSVDSFVLIELPKDVIRINKKELSNTLYEKYERLFSKYKVKHKEQRQIRMSQHTIQIGEFYLGGFTGTSIIVE